MPLALEDRVARGNRELAGRMLHRVRDVICERYRSALVVIRGRRWRLVGCRLVVGRRLVVRRGPRFGCRLAVGRGLAVDVERIGGEPAIEDVLTRRVEIRSVLVVARLSGDLIVACKKILGLVVPTGGLVAVTHAAPA